MDNKISSISYKRFLDNFANEFIVQYKEDLISVFNSNNKITFGDYLFDIDLIHRAREEFRYNITHIAKDLNMNYIDSLDFEGDEDIFKEVYIDLKSVIANRMRAYLLDGTYSYLAQRIKL
jgi:hypothetical protein